jgi:hypothetical protein
MNGAGKLRYLCEIFAISTKECEQLRSFQILHQPTSWPLGSRLLSSRSDGRVQTFRIVGEDEADPKAGSISFVSPRRLASSMGCRRLTSSF